MALWTYKNEKKRSWSENITTASMFPTAPIKLAGIVAGSGDHNFWLMMIWCLVSTMAISQSAMPMNWEMNGQPLTFRVITIINSSCIQCRKLNNFNTFRKHNKFSFHAGTQVISERVKCVIVKYFQMLFFSLQPKICWCENKNKKKRNSFKWFSTLFYQKNF